MLIHILSAIAGAALVLITMRAQEQKLIALCYRLGDELAKKDVEIGNTLREGAGMQSVGNLWLDSFKKDRKQFVKSMLDKTLE